MSKLLDTYNSLKEENNSCLYLIKSGIFYVSLEEDAKQLSELFNFKITNLNENTIKCGFPEKKLDFYTNILKNCSINFKVVDTIFDNKSYNSSINLENQKIIFALDKIKKLDLNSVSFKKSFEILENLKSLLNSFGD